MSAELSRRGFLTRSGALLGASALLSRPGHAWVAPRDRRFVFVLVYGGWDPTRVFAAEFDNPMVAMEAAASPAQIGDLRFVDHPSRASVSRFFSRYGSRCTIVNGLVVPSVSHVACMKLAMTGSSRESKGDWPVLLASGASERFGLPHVVVHGPQYPGPHSGLVTRVGVTGHVQALLDGSLMQRNDAPLPVVSDPVRAAVDAHAREQLQREKDRARSPRKRDIVDAMGTASRRGDTVQGVADQVRWGSESSLPGQFDTAVDLLRLNLARCVTVTTDDMIWDSHQFNDDKQSTMFEGLFSQLNDFMVQLDETPGSSGATLGDETVVVLMSEMGRTPHMNSGRGKDHWSHTSMMLVGKGLNGGRTLGGFSDLFYGLPLGPDGSPRADGRPLSTPLLGASLLAMGDVDPGPILGIDRPMEALLGP